eukprot:GHVR01031965.1.p1 GENE.GHVR01031965.1~~GHVR01031965.1.p1  ORF type:complete len:317 (+),score=57.98 GHVR01031965.1:73-1023(+)
MMRTALTRQLSLSGFRESLRDSVMSSTAVMSSSAPSYQQTRYFGTNDKALQLRMKSVKNIQKITNAMKMVAASKLKSDQRRLTHGTPFSIPLQRLFGRIPVDRDQTSPLMVVAISSDKGLCGGVNSQIARLTKATILDNEANGSEVHVVGVGDKLRAALVKSFGNRFLYVLTDASKVVSFTSAAAIADMLQDSGYKRLIAVYNQFKSVVSYSTVALDVHTKVYTNTLPLREMDAIHFEPERKEMWNDLNEYYLACTLYSCMLEGAVSEQSARVTAMDAATKNAGDMLSTLSLKYNNARQAKVTMELIEIISGANAL